MRALLSYVKIAKSTKESVKANAVLDVSAMELRSVPAVIALVINWVTQRLADTRRILTPRAPSKSGISCSLHRRTDVCTDF